MGEYRKVTLSVRDDLLANKDVTSSSVPSTVQHHQDDHQQQHHQHPYDKYIVDPPDHEHEHEHEEHDEVRHQIQRIHEEQMGSSSAFAPSSSSTSLAYDQQLLQLTQPTADFNIHAELPRTSPRHLYNKETNTIITTVVDPHTAQPQPQQVDEHLDPLGLDANDTSTTTTSFPSSSSSDSNTNTRLAQSSSSAFSTRTSTSTSSRQPLPPVQHRNLKLSLSRGPSSSSSS
jgi:hypothetical protein